MWHIVTKFSLAGGCGADDIAGQVTGFSLAGGVWCQIYWGVELPGFSLELLCEIYLGVDFYLI